MIKQTLTFYSQIGSFFGNMIYNQHVFIPKHVFKGMKEFKHRD